MTRATLPRRTRKAPRPVHLERDDGKGWSSCRYRSIESLFGLCVRANFDKPPAWRDGGLPAAAPVASGPVSSTSTSDSRRRSTDSPSTSSRNGRHAIACAISSLLRLPSLTCARARAAPSIPCRRGINAGRDRRPPPAGPSRPASARRCARPRDLPHRPSFGTRADLQDDRNNRCRRRSAPYCRSRTDPARTRPTAAAAPVQVNDGTVVPSSSFICAAILRAFHPRELGSQPGRARRGGYNPPTPTRCPRLSQVLSLNRSVTTSCRRFSLYRLSPTSILKHDATNNSDVVSNNNGEKWHVKVLRVFKVCVTRHF